MSEQIGLDFDVPAEPSPFDEAWPHHGRTTGYRYGCRCDLCRQAKAGGRPKVPPPPADWQYHGSDTGYRYGCRCDPCSAAHAARADASRKSAGRERTCQRCSSTYVYVKNSGTGTAYCAPCRPLAARGRPIPRPLEPCNGCQTPTVVRLRAPSNYGREVPVSASWHLCPACSARIPGGLRDALSRHRAPIEFVLRVSASPHCEICGVDVTVKVKTHKGAWRYNFALDHDHDCCLGGQSCGKCLRGLLCLRCNSGIGYLGEDQARLLAAVDYLARHAKGGGDPVDQLAVARRAHKHEGRGVLGLSAVEILGPRGV